MERRLTLMLLAFALIIGSMSLARASDLCAERREGAAVVTALEKHFQATLEDYLKVQTQSIDTKGNGRPEMFRRRELGKRLDDLERSLGDAERSRDEAKADLASVDRQISLAHVSCSTVAEQAQPKVVAPLFLDSETRPIRARDDHRSGSLNGIQ